MIENAFDRDFKRNFLGDIHCVKSSLAVADMDISDLLYHLCAGFFLDILVHPVADMLLYPR